MVHGHEYETYGETAIELIYQHYRRPILAYLYRLINNPETAEDLCQETFLKVVRNWKSYDPNQPIGPWLYRIAANTAYDHLRHRRRIRFSPLFDNHQLPNAGRSMESQLDESEPVQHALAQMPASYRLPLVLYACEGHSTQEIANTLGCSTGAIKSRLFRARERFRQLYHDEH